MRLPQEIIAAKRDGERLGANDIRQMIAGLTDGSVSEGQPPPSPWRSSSATWTPRSASR